MDQVYAARLSATPHPPPPGPSAQSMPGAIHIQPHPFPAPTPASVPAPTAPNTVPIQLPNIFVSPYPPPPPMRALTTPPPANIPSAKLPRTAAGSSAKIKIGPVSLFKPHPLLWISFALSLVALVLGVPKGSLPTLTGRHKALRIREKLVGEKLHLISHLAHFLPPPLAPLVHPSPAHTPGIGRWWTTDADAETDPHHAALQFWNTQTSSRSMHDGQSAGTDGERWWAVQELGEGASVVRSRGEGKEKEVWVLRMGEATDPDRPLLSALTHSLLLRDKLQRDLDAARSFPHTDIRPAHPNPLQHSDTAGARLLTLAHTGENNERRDPRDESAEERDRAGEHKRRERERAREKEVEEREREVVRREKWVVEEMRKLSDKVHAQATELTLEDRITERLKSYQRQLAHLNEDRGVEHGLAPGHGHGQGQHHEHTPSEPVKPHH